MQGNQADLLAHAGGFLPQLAVINQPDSSYSTRSVAGACARSSNPAIDAAIQKHRGRHGEDGSHKTSREGL